MLLVTIEKLFLKREHSCLVNQGGFTLFEVVVVVVLVSILAGTMMLKTTPVSDRAAINQADQLRRDLTHIQVLALGWSVALRLTVSSTGYTITCRSTNFGTPCTTTGGTPIDPATGEEFKRTLTDNVSIAAACTSGDSSTDCSIVDFDSLGRPWGLSGSTYSLLSTNPARTYTLTGGTRSDIKVYLRPITGFAEASY